MTVGSALPVAAPVIGLSIGVLIGGFVGFSIVRRVAERRRRAAAQRAGLTVSQMLQRIVALSPTGVAVVDRHRDVVFSNARARELGVVGDRLLDDRAWVAAQRTLADGEQLDVDLTPARTSSPRGPQSVHGHVRLLAGEDRRFAVIFATDDSELARMEAARRDFAANVSHELKTPVGAMALLAEALLASHDDPETVQRFGGKLLMESHRLGNMVNELIELSRLQGAQRLPDLEAVDVDTVVAEALTRSKVAADNASIEIATDRPSDLQVLGDQGLLVTAVANLVSNAISYSPSGSPVSISRRVRGGNVEIAVTDRGIGIAREHQERVFERFFRVDQARSRATGGTGLGLAIVKHIAANHNGAIRLWSQPGTGSTFTLSIPAYTDGPAYPDEEGDI